MKMILIFTNKDDITVDVVIQGLRSAHVPFLRLNTEDILNSYQLKFDIKSESFVLVDVIRKHEYDLNDVSSVYYRRPGIPDVSLIDDVTNEERIYIQREAFAILDAIYKVLDDRFWINNVFRIREAENKVFQLLLAQSVGFTIPQTALTNNYEDIRQFLSGNNCIIKPIRSGNVNPKSAKEIIYTSELMSEDICEENASQFPLYLQERIKKAADVRCVVVGNEVFSAKILSQDVTGAEVDWRRSEEYIEQQVYQLPEEIKKKCVEITKLLGLTYSAIDLILTEDGNHIFLECNPNGQWAWLELRLGLPISNSIIALLKKNEDERII